MTRYDLMKRIDIIVEVPLMRTMARQLDSLNVSGYSVMPIIAGRGMVNAWSSEGQVSNTAGMVALLCFVDPSRAELVVETATEALRGRIGFLTISDVFVVRPDLIAS